MASWSSNPSPTQQPPTARAETCLLPWRRPSWGDDLKASVECPSDAVEFQIDSFDLTGVVDGEEIETLDLFQIGSVNAHWCDNGNIRDRSMEMSERCE